MPNNSEGACMCISGVKKNFYFWQEGWERERTNDGLWAALWGLDPEKINKEQDGSKTENSDLMTHGWDMQGVELQHFCLIWSILIKDIPKSNIVYT